jgi:Lipopolysaccharide-assembly
MRAYLFLSLLGILGLSGCANYHLGTSGHISFRTLYVAPVVNDSYLPQAVAPISTELREAFLHDSRIILVNSAEEADATLTVRLLKYRRAGKSSNNNDTGLARNFDVSVETEVSLRDNRDNHFIFENRKIDASREVFGDSGQLQAEFQNVPLLAETLAKQIRSATLDTW